MATLFGVYERTKKKKKNRPTNSPPPPKKKTIEKNHYKEALFVKPTLNLKILK
jgi:hypothetical protein